MPVKYEPWAIKNEQMDVWGFKILEGKFDKVIISINDVKIEDGTSDCVLDYTFMNIPEEFTEDELTHNIEFKELLQSVILNILEKAIDEYNKNRDGDPTESIV